MVRGPPAALARAGRAASTGLYQVEAKTNPGQGTGPNIILWPDNNSWPPEIDLLEAPNGKGDAFMTLHWAGAGNSNQYTTIDTGVNVNSFHDYAVDWEPNQLTFYVDGKSVWTTTQNIPHQTMGLGFAGYVANSGDSWYGGGPNGSTPSTVATLQVQWASVSKPAGGAAQTNALAGSTAAITPQNTVQAMNGATAYSTTGDLSATAAQTLASSPGTNILQGGSGNDTFQVNTASPDGWAEIDNWHAGDTAAFLGAIPGQSTVTWADATDTLGHWGATASISLNGNGHIDRTCDVRGCRCVRAARRCYRGLEHRRAAGNGGAWLIRK